MKGRSSQKQVLMFVNNINIEPTEIIHVCFLITCKVSADVYHFSEQPFLLVRFFINNAGVIKIENLFRLLSVLCKGTTRKFRVELITSNHKIKAQQMTPRWLEITKLKHLK